MIDIEFDLFTELANLLENTFTGIDVNSEYVDTPPSFPSVSIVEISNLTKTSTITSSDFDNFADIAYEVNIYSNKTTGKIECKQIASVIDTFLLQRNFTRSMLQPIPNFADAKIHRYVGRYEASVSKDKVLFRR